MAALADHYEREGAYSYHAKEGDVGHLTENTLVDSFVLDEVPHFVAVKEDRENIEEQPAGNGYVASTCSTRGTKGQ